MIGSNSPKSPRETLCGVRNPAEPERYSCTYPLGHVVISDPERGLVSEHGVPEAGLWWSMPAEAYSNTSVEERLALEVAQLKGILLAICGDTHREEANTELGVSERFILGPRAEEAMLTYRLSL